MLNKLTLNLLTLLLFTLAVNAQVSLNAIPQGDSLVELLDRTINQSHTYVEQKESKLVSLRNELKPGHSPVMQYENASKLFKEFKSYKYDSAWHYANRMLHFAEIINDPNLLCESKIALAFSCMSAGLFKETVEIASSVDTTVLADPYKEAFYSFLSVMYLSMSDYTATQPYFDIYRSNSLLYTRKAYALADKDSPAALMLKMREYQLKNYYREALATGQKYLADTTLSPHEFAIGASTVAFFYEVHGDTAKALQYLIRAAIADIRMAVKETSAIRQVADLFYKRGDVRHAYDYAMVALDDANFYNARHRKIEVGQILPIIEDGRFDIINRQKDKILTFAILSSILLVLFFAAALIIFLQKRRLSKARKMILNQNAELRQSNHQLKYTQDKISSQNTDLILMNEKLMEVHRIKDEYIGFFFSANSSYIERMEEYKRMVVRYIKNGHPEELLKSVSPGNRKEKEEMFKLFDQIFMRLFPDFIERYNQLFDEADRVTIAADGHLTPELRIFALIRLGITENERIARLLDFSVSTIKNYKTRTKNKSLIPNDHFEQEIMRIQSVKTVNDGIQSVKTVNDGIQSVKTVTTEFNQ